MTPTTIDREITAIVANAEAFFRFNGYDGEELARMLGRVAAACLDRERALLDTLPGDDAPPRE